MLNKLLGISLVLFAAFPATTTYQLNSYGFGSGGTANSTTSTYSIEGISGEIGGQTSTTSTYTLRPGFNETQQAHAPKILVFNNGSGAYYNKLHFEIDQQNNPSDALYALQISTSSNFSTGVNYVKSDMTIGSVLNLADYQTYTTWGGVSGAEIIGLTPNTTYYLRAKSTQGKFTESAYGPSLSASTLNPSLSFSLSPTSINMGDLSIGSVINAPSSISIGFSTNALSGGDVYINGANGGLKSTLKTNTITSASGDLSSLSHGFGAQVTAAGQSSGGPFTKLSPYNLATNNVGIVDTAIRKILTSSTPVTTATASVLLKAKANFNDPASTDYSETVTVIATASF